jgi:hypothetical protein
MGISILRYTSAEKPNRRKLTMANSGSWYQVKVLLGPDKDGTGAREIFDENVHAPSTEVATLLAAWSVPAEDQNADVAGRLEIFVKRVANSF